MKTKTTETPATIRVLAIMQKSRDSRSVAETPARRKRVKHGTKKKEKAIGKCE
jgi:hypothetical protein